MTRRKLCKNSTWVSKYAEFDADFEFIEIVAKTLLKKSFNKKVTEKWSFLLLILCAYNFLG